MGGSIGEHVWRQSYKMSTSQVTFGANLIKCQLLMSTSTVILARILQSVNFSIYRYILGNTNTGVCSDIGNTNTSIHPVSYCAIWNEAVLIPDLSAHWGTDNRCRRPDSSPSRTFGLHCSGVKSDPWTIAFEIRCQSTASRLRSVPVGPGVLNPPLAGMNWY